MPQNNTEYKIILMNLQSLICFDLATIASRTIFREYGM